MQITATDSSFASGQAGVWSYQPGSARAHSFDDFSITQLGASLGGAKVLAKPAQQTAPPPEVTSYYYFGGKRVAMRKNSTVTWLHSDHLGSASLATDLNGIPVPGSETRYKPFGEIRFGSSGLPTDRRFTGYARERASYVGSLDFASARYYSPYLGRFISADTLVQAPGDPQTLNRYGYTRNNPVRYVDPSGHCFGFALGLDTLGCIGFGMMVASGLGLAGVASYELMPDQIKADAARAIDTLVTDLTRGPASINNTAGSAPSMQQPLVLANPAESVNVVGTIESFPMGGEASPLMLTTPLGASSTVQMGGPLFAKKTKSNVQENKAKGDAFRDDVADAFRQQGYDVDTEVTKQTPFGPRRVDVQVSKDGKVLGGVETKTGNSRYTASQRSKDNWLKRFADYVVNVVRRK